MHILTKTTLVALSSTLFFSIAEAKEPVDIDTSDSVLLENISMQAVEPVKTPFTSLTMIVDGKHQFALLPQDDSVVLVAAKKRDQSTVRNLKSVVGHALEAEIAIANQ